MKTNLYSKLFAFLIFVASALSMSAQSFQSELNSNYIILNKEDGYSLNKTKINNADGTVTLKMLWQLIDSDDQHEYMEAFELPRLPKVVVLSVILKKDMTGAIQSIDFYGNDMKDRFSSFSLPDSDLFWNHVSEILPFFISQADLMQIKKVANF